MPTACPKTTPRATRLGNTMRTALHRCNAARVATRALRARGTIWIRAIPRGAPPNNGVALVYMP
eukprot:7744350-Lingulodinium_polyedra.AAC.1